MQQILALGSRLERPLRWLIVAAFAVMVGSAILQVIFRYAIGSPLGWSEELAKLAMLWWCFMGVGMLAASRRMLAIDALLLALPPRWAHLVSGIAHTISAVFTVWLAWLGIRLVALAGNQITPALDIPYAWVYLSLPAGLVIASIAFAVNAALDFQRVRHGVDGGPVRIADRSDI